MDNQPTPEFNANEVSNEEESDPDSPKESLRRRILLFTYDAALAVRQNRIAQIFLAIALIILVWMAIFRTPLLVFLISLLIIVVLKYIKGIKTIPFEIAPVVFLTMMLTHNYGIWYGGAFAIIAVWIGVIATGGDIDPATPIYPFLLVILALSFIFLRDITGFIVAGLIVSVLEFAANTGIQLGIGAGFEDVLPFTIIHLAINIVLFLTIGRLFTGGVII